MELISIVYKGKRYQARTLEVNGEQITVADIELEWVLLVDGSRYASEKARIIDESICYYVPHNVLEWSDNAIIQYIAQYIDKEILL